MKYLVSFLLILVGIILLVIKTLVYTMPSDAMMPHIKSGSHLVVISSEYSNGFLPKNGEVVMYQTYKMDKPAFSRIAGCPGDTLSLNGGLLTLNGNTYKEPYVDDQEFTIMPQVKVLDGRYFLLNDNRSMLSDSRNKDIGMIRKDDIKGRVVLVF
ncbi:MAG: signal peptidase I [Selenomonas sp.]|nr:signal peptidase I [Selenomonas sp.]